MHVMSLGCSHREVVDASAAKRKKFGVAPVSILVECSLEVSYEFCLVGL